MLKVSSPIEILKRSTYYWARCEKTLPWLVGLSPPPMQIGFANTLHHRPFRRRPPLPILKALLFRLRATDFLVFAAEEADRPGHGQVGIEHLLLGLLREEGCAAAKLLRARGADPDRIREELLVSPHRPPSTSRGGNRKSPKSGRNGSLCAGCSVPQPGTGDNESSRVGNYTISAARLMFFARYHAGRSGSPMV